MNCTIEEYDEELGSIISNEKFYQNSHLNLHPDENMMINSARKVLGSILTNKYSEGYPGSRYYSGTEIIDKIESLCMNRLKKFFNLEEEGDDEWLLNVQCYSGTHASLAICMGSINRKDRILTINSNKDKKIILEKYYEVDFYSIDKKNKKFDLEELRLKCSFLRPKLLIVPSNILPVFIDFKSISDICEEYNIILAIDISEIAILISTNRYGDNNNNPFKYGHVIFSSTQSSIGGPKGGFIMVNNTKKPGLFQKINLAVFPGLQGGPHNHQIASLAVQLHGLMNSQLNNFVSKSLNNSQILARTLKENDIPLLCNGTETHLVAIDCCQLDLPCELLSKILYRCKIRHSYNKYGDKESSIIFGTFIYTFREGSTTQMKILGNLISECVFECIEIKKMIEQIDEMNIYREKLIEEKISKNTNLELISNKVLGIVQGLEPVNLD